MDEAGDLFAMAGDDDLLTRFDEIEEVVEPVFGFQGADAHGMGLRLA